MELLAKRATAPRALKQVRATHPGRCFARFNDAENGGLEAFARTAAPIPERASLSHRAHTREYVRQAIAANVRVTSQGYRSHRIMDASDGHDGFLSAPRRKMQGRNIRQNRARFGLDESNSNTFPGCARRTFRPNRVRMKMSGKLVRALRKWFFRKLKLQKWHVERLPWKNGL